MLKALLRSPVVQGLLAFLSANYVRLLLATMRWRYENRELAEPLIAGPDGVILLFWHGRIVTAMTLRGALGAKRRKVMISLSRDGEFVAKAAEQVGFPAIRGSVSKGGATVLRQALDTLAAGEAMLVTPDGPRGPNQTMPIGPVQLARLSGAPVILIGLASRPCWRFASWDQAATPLPFATAAIVLAGPFRVPRDAGETALEAARIAWQADMRAAQAKAETLLGGRP